MIATAPDVAIRDERIAPSAEEQAFDQPTFLVGSVRSGTTLLRLMLDHHPELAFFHEFPFAVDLLTRPEWPGMGEVAAYLNGHRIFQDSRLAIDASLDYPALMNSFLRQKRDRDGKREVGAVVHTHFDRLLRIWPRARFIHILRDGRDVARSRVALGWSGNTYTGVESWIEAERLWENLCTIVPAERRTEIRYETLVSWPEAELTRLCAFMGLSYHPSMLSYPRDSTYEAPDTKLIGQWRTKLSRRAVQLAEARIADMLVERGYELSGFSRIRMSRMTERAIKADDRFNRLKFRRRLYGTKLFAAELAIRLTEPIFRRAARMRDQIRARLHEVERSTLK